jgi:hypothetical protein
MTKLALGSFISFSPRCSFRKRLYEASGGYAIDLGDLARGIREYLSCIDNDPQILQYAESHPAKWGVMKGYLVESAWETYYVRWEQIYRNRMTTMRWIAAGFALPFPKYLNIFTAVLIRAAKSTLLDLVKRYCPPAYTLYRGFKTKLTKTGENGAEASL